MRHLLRLIATLALVVLCESHIATATAQWQVPDHSMPVGRGSGTGFKAVGPCTANQVLVWSGTSADPACAAVPLPSGAQPLDATLTAIAALTTAANKGLYFTGVDAVAIYDLSSFARGLMSSASADAFLSGLGFANFTNHGIVIGNGTRVPNTTAAMTDGQVLVGQTGNDPLPKTVSGDCTLTASGAITCPNSGPNVRSGRCTLTSATAVTTADVTAATSLFFTPYKGNRVALYSSGAWTSISFSEITLSLSGYTASKLFDIYAYNNAGTLTLESLVWTDDTTRATAIALQDGVYVKSGDATRRLLCTIYTTATGQTEDSAAKRHVSNVENAEYRPMRAVDSTDSWTYNTATYRRANGGTVDINVFRWTASTDRPVQAQCVSIFDNDTAGNGSCNIGIDSNTVPSAQIVVRGFTNAAGYRATTQAFYQGYPGVGRHGAAWLEIGKGSGTQTWFGDAGDATVTQNGILGGVFN